VLNDVFVAGLPGLEPVYQHGQLSLSLQYALVQVMHRESKKTCHHTFAHIFAKYLPTLKIISLAHSAEHLQ